MIATVAPLPARPAWKALAAHHAAMKDVTLASLFAADAGRGDRLCAEAAGVFLDYSKNRLTDETLRLLLQLAEESGLRERIAAMFRGEHVNASEDRAALHIALRAPRIIGLRADMPPCEASTIDALERLLPGR